MTGADPLGKLSESIADGESIDWDSLRALAPDEGTRQLIEHLRVVAGVAEVHRSQAVETAEVTTGDREPSVTGPLPQTSSRWGHLLLIRKIGEGAFGEVYEAIDTWLDHPRALKLLKPDVANRVSAPQILHEARKLVRVRHPNVVMVHGADSHDGRVGFWMDLIEGQTLEQRLRDGRLSAGEATYIGKELCRALAAVHQANLLHRDIKAQNVMRASDGGRIILMDFGAGEFQNTRSEGRPHGTPLYLAPELTTGGPATVRSDIYALGVLLYYLVTGRFPVEGRSLAELVIAHARGDRRHLRDERPDLPDSFVKVVERAIHADPARRFESAGQLHAALEEHRTDAPPSTIKSVPLIQKPDVPVAPPTARLTLAHLAIGAGCLAVLIAACGLTACRVFEVAMHIPAEFAAGPSEYLSVGTWAVVPFLWNWLAGITLFAVLAGIRAALGSRLSRFVHPVKQRIFAVPPVTLATAIPIGAAIIWIAITWVYWPLFEKVYALQIAEKPPVLDPSFRFEHINYSEFCAILSFVLILAAWRLWPALERQASDVSTVRGLRWATLGLAALIVVWSAVPRRIAFDRFEIVQYGNRPSFVIATKGDELLLYQPDSVGTVRPRVRRDAPDVIPTHERRTLVGR
jgi:serine/threonine-protein kinase